MFIWVKKMKLWMNFFEFSIFWGVGAEEGSPHSISQIQMFKWENWFTEVRNLQFLRRSSQLLKPWFETELSFCSFIETSPTIEVPSTSTTCCCRQINFQLLISEFWENQILRSPREKIFSLTLTFFLLCVGYFGQPANILHLRLFCRINNKNTTL